MSHAIPFDTLEFVEQLKAVGVPEDQAKGHVKVLATVVRQMDARVDELAAKRDKQTEEKFDTLADRNEERVKSRLDGLATKEELTNVEANLKRDIKELDTKMDNGFKAADAKLKELELRMVIKMGIMIIGGIGLLFGLMRAWPIPVQYVPPAPHAQEMRLPAPASTRPAAPIPPGGAKP